MILFTPGCNQNTKKAVLTAGIEKYAPTMSSAPGIPLAVSYNQDKKPKDVIYHWTADYGRFLSWDGAVNILGRDIKNQRDNIYWSVDFNEEIPVSKFYIHLSIEDKSSGKLFSKARLAVELDRHGYFIIKKNYIRRK